MNHYTQLKDVLNEIFELDKADLDFGIYRIINQKRKQVTEFIDKQLPNDIKKALSETQSSDKTEIENELREFEKNAEKFKFDLSQNEDYLRLKERLKLAENTDILEQEVFSHLANFFRRYYKDGDFISMRRYKKDVYAIPYEGEEVKLHWANHDQYYIKSSENFKNYSFQIADGKKVTFQLKEVSTEQNNNKTQGDAERRFAIYANQPVEETDEELFINFIYEPFPKSTKQDALLSEALDVLSAAIPANYTGVNALSPTEKNTKRTLLEKHLNDYVSKNSFDYFIHKDLGGFLTRELDFYIKNEVLYLDDINTKQADFFVAQLSKVKAIRVVAQKVIDFLAQIENFQKKLWLKKKFVIRTDYCITLDKIPSSYYAEIFQNTQQLAEWKTLFDVQIINPEQLTFEPYLVLDTQFFDEVFKDRLLAEFDDLDQQTDGLLINSENFQALSLLVEKYQEKVDVTYIDPPYNTGKNDFAYKDTFKHSSWMSFMFDRIDLNQKLLNSYSGAFLGNIDKRELFNFKAILDSFYSEENFINAIVNVNNPKGRSDQKHLPTAHDNILFYANDGFVSFGWEPTDKVLKRYNLQENGKKYREIDLRKTGDNDRRIDRPNLFYYFYFNEGSNELIISRDKRLDLSHWVEITPMKSPLEEGRWRWELESSIKNQERLTARYMPVKGQWSIFEKDFYVEGERVLPTSIWDEKPFNSERGTETFINLGFDKEDFPRPKPVGLIEYLVEHTTSNKSQSLILDYFMGSGTSVSSILKVNRLHGNKRKFIGIEMGEYFRKIAIIRIKKNIYSENWENGKPEDKGGISQIVKYQVLESYEDTLNNLFLKPTTELDFSGKAREEYLIQYMLEMESREHLFNLEMFRKPFDYQLKVTENNELKPTKVDLVETFNYLIGLYVSKVQRVKDIKVVEGTTRTGIKTLVIWRNLDTTTHEEVEKLLRRFYDSQRTKEFQQIYINGDHHLENLRSEGDQFKIKLIEETFFKKMFNEIEL
mgnify:CR=1 FL=1